MREEKIVAWQCPDCGDNTQEDDINNTLLPTCGACETAFHWDDLEGFAYCKACYHPYEKLPGIDYCQNCFDYEKHLQDLWERFMKIPVQKECITEDFDVWSTGTNYLKIWNWFEEQAPRGIHYVIYTNQEDLDDYKANK